MPERISSGSRVLDDLLDGGYEPQIITTIYGPAGAGKTTLALLASISVARKKRKVVYIDTESSFSLERLKQLAPDYLEVLDYIVFMRPQTFEAQSDSFDKLRRLALDRNTNLGLIVVDTIAMLYRLEVGQAADVYEINKKLGAQLGLLAEIAYNRRVPVLVTNQVYADFERKEGIKMVGGDILKYSSKCLIELQAGHSGVRKAIVRKHRSIPESREVVFRIVGKGLSEVKERKFGLF